MDVSKTKSSFYRRLYVAYLIDSGLASSCLLYTSDAADE